MKLTIMKWNSQYAKIGLSVLLALTLEIAHAKNCSTQTEIINPLNKSAKKESKKSILTFVPYLGLEYQYIHIKAKNDWRNILSANYNNGGIFVGSKLHKYFGLEIGYYHSLKTSQEQDVITGFAGNPANGPTATITRTKYKGFSFDLNLYYPLDPKFNFNLLAGVMTLHPMFTIQANGNTNLANALNVVKGRNYTAFRAGVGVEYVEKHWGARGRLLWINTGNMQLNIQNADQIFPGIISNAFEQTYGLAVGLFYIF